MSIVIGNVNNLHTLKFLINGEESVFHDLLILFTYLYGFWNGVGPHICDWPWPHHTSLRPWAYLTPPDKQLPRKSYTCTMCQWHRSCFCWRKKITETSLHNLTLSKMKWMYTNTTLCSKVFLVELTIAQLVKFLHFIASTDVVLCSQDPSTELGNSSPQPDTQFLRDSLW